MTALSELEAVLAKIAATKPDQWRAFAYADVVLFLSKHADLLRQRLVDAEPVLYRYWQPSLKRWGYTEDGVVHGSQPLYAAPPNTPTVEQLHALVPFPARSGVNARNEGWNDCSATVLSRVEALIEGMK